MGVVAAAAERVRSVVKGSVLAALTSVGVPEISVGASYEMADHVSTCAANQFARALYIEVALGKKRELVPVEEAALMAALTRAQRLGSGA